MQNQFGSTASIASMMPSGSQRAPRAAQGDLANCLMMAAVDANFDTAVDLFESRIRFQQNQVTVRAAGRIEVRHGPRQVFRQMKIETSTANGVEFLHAQANRQEGHLPLQKTAHKNAIVFFTSLVHCLHGSVHRLLLATRIHVEPARHDHAVQFVEQCIELRFFIERRNDDRYPAGRQHDIRITGVEPQVGDRTLAGGNEIGIDANKGPMPRIVLPSFSLRGTGRGVPCRAGASRASYPGFRSAGVYPRSLQTLKAYILHGIIRSRQNQALYPSDFEFSREHSLRMRGLALCRHVICAGDQLVYPWDRARRPFRVLSPRQEVAIVGWTLTRRVSEARLTPDRSSFLCRSSRLSSED